MSAELAVRVADAFDLPGDYFAEYREYQVIEAIRHDSALRDRIYARLRHAQGGVSRVEPTFGAR